MKGVALGGAGAVPGPQDAGVLGTVSSQSPALCLHTVGPQERVLPAPTPCHPDLCTSPVPLYLTCTPSAERRCEALRGPGRELACTPTPDPGPRRPCQHR